MKCLYDMIQTSCKNKDIVAYQSMTVGRLSTTIISRESQNTPGIYDGIGTLDMRPEMLSEKATVFICQCTAKLCIVLETESYIILIVMV